MQAAPQPPPTLLDALDGRDRAEPALSRDGTTWLTVGALLDACRVLRTGDRRPVAVPPGDPVEALRRLLAAEADGAVPVVGAPAQGGDVLGRVAAIGGRAPLLVVVTSGSGGTPRAVVRTVASWQLSLPGYDALVAPRPDPRDDVAWVPGAASSTLTLFALWHALATGRPAVAPGAWHAGRAVATGGRARVLHCVPTVLDDALQARAAGAAPALERAVVAGARVPAPLRRRAAELGVQVAEYYGAAELSFVAADPDGTGLRAFPGAELAVRDGAVWVRSPYVCLGYLGDGCLGEHRAGGPLRRDGAGWASVGDLGELSPAGVLTVRGRGDGTATVGGATVTLADVERALGEVEGIAELVALAEPDPRFGERVLAVVRPAVPGPHGDLVAAVRAAARLALPQAARPVRVVVRSALPRTPGGKVARAALRAQVLAEPAAVPTLTLGA